MGNKKIVETTANRGEFNRAYKQHLEKTGKIHCSRCPYHRYENDGRKCYGSNKKRIRYPNWKLVSKNPRQWMEKSITLVEKTYGYGKWERNYTLIKF